MHFKKITKKITIKIEISELFQFNKFRYQYLYFRIMDHSSMVFHGRAMMAPIFRPEIFESISGMIFLAYLIKEIPISDFFSFQQWHKTKFHGIFLAYEILLQPKIINDSKNNQQTQSH